MNRQKVLVLHQADNVAVALMPLDVGETLSLDGSQIASSVLVRMPIATGHKIALCALRRGQMVIKYGQPIGVATQDIGSGEHVHIHNLASARAG